MLSNLGTLAEQRYLILPTTCDLENLFQLFFAIAQSPSLVVSIPILVAFTRLLHNTSISGSPAMSPLMGPLLELCCSRLVRYESTAEDTDIASLMFLVEDVDTIPERHAFLGNYRRCCSSVIELMVRQKSSEALYYIFGKVDNALDRLYDGQAAFNRLSHPHSLVQLLLTSGFSRDFLEINNASIASRCTVHSGGVVIEGLHEMAKF